MDKETKKKKPAPQRKRARNPKGTYKADDPNTPINEAWESVEAVKPKKDYAVKQKVTTTTSGKSTAGKYGKTKSLRPTFGNVTTKHY